MMKIHRIGYLVKRLEKAGFMKIDKPTPAPAISEGGYSLVPPFHPNRFCGAVDL